MPSENIRTMHSTKKSATHSVNQEEETKSKKSDSTESEENTFAPFF